MEKDNVISLFTTDLNSFKEKPLIFFETRVGRGDKNKKKDILKIARTVAHYIIDGEIIREYRPVMLILNNQTAQILLFKRKDKKNDTSKRREEGTDLRDEQSRNQDGEKQ